MAKDFYMKKKRYFMHLKSEEVLQHMELEFMVELLDMEEEEKQSFMSNLKAQIRLWKMEQKMEGVTYYSALYTETKIFKNSKRKIFIHEFENKVFNIYITDLTGNTRSIKHSGLSEEQMKMILKDEKKLDFVKFMVDKNKSKKVGA